MYQSPVNALIKEDSNRKDMTDYATIAEKSDPVCKSNIKKSGEVNVFKTLSEVDKMQLSGGRPNSKNLLTIPWWWNFGLGKKLYILMLNIFLTGAQFAFAMAGNSMALSTDAVCRMAQIFSHFVSIFPFVFPNSKTNFRNQVVASGVSGFVFLGAIMVFFFDALEDIYYKEIHSVNYIPVVIFGSLGISMSIISLGCYRLYFETLDKETRRQGSGTFVIIDIVRATILIADGVLMCIFPSEETQVDAWSTIIMCVCMFWTVVNDLWHWKKFATPFVGKKNRTDAQGSIFRIYPEDGRSIITYENGKNNEMPPGGSSGRATAATSAIQTKSRMETA